MWNSEPLRIKCIFKRIWGPERFIITTNFAFDGDRQMKPVGRHANNKTKSGIIAFPALCQTWNKWKAPQLGVARKNAFAFIEFLQFLIRVFFELLQPSLFRCKRSGNEFYCRMVFSLKLKTTSQWFALLLNIHKKGLHTNMRLVQLDEAHWNEREMSFIWKRRKRRKIYCISEKMKTCSWSKARSIGILINGTGKVSEVSLTIIK